jgi:hypothetical protein
METQGLLRDGAFLAEFASTPQTNTESLFRRFLRSSTSIDNG